MDWLTASWYRPSILRFLLWPVSVVFCALTILRKQLYRLTLLRTHWFPVPVIVVGNITVGGTGKTPLVIKLVELCRKAGYTPGVISRGYGVQAESYPMVLREGHTAASVGDEPLMIFRHTGCRVVIDPDRPRGVGRLLKSQCDIVISDDGLQHYALGRDMEIAVIDGARGLGNRMCLPAGPLREPVTRLADVDMTVISDTSGKNRRAHASAGWRMHLEPRCFVNVFDAGRRQPLDAFRRQRVHAVAGIGNPGRFFLNLSDLGCETEQHVFPDHHPYMLTDMQFGDDRPVIMTEKDAIKFEQYIGQMPAEEYSRYWYLKADVVVDDESAFLKELMSFLEEK
ncbi:MAG: tetraacyldisaccharide 4'-kinase [Gammaproteobacteria bacterium]|nr:tetraacyldisaccharide 4'-kinase [Gammaproteobacteria bacterium]